MLISVDLVVSLIAASSVSIVEPADGGIYDGDWLPIRAIIENENVLPDSVLFSLNGVETGSLSRLDTDWYTYMGNDLHTGVSLSPAPDSGELLWSAPVTGTDHEFPTPVIVNGIVYYPANYGSDSLYALDSATGEILWKYRVGGTDDAVTVKDGLLFVASDSLFCLNALTGELVWVNGNADWSGSTPAVTGDVVYCGKSNQPSVPSQVFCLDRATGEEVWSSNVMGELASCMTFWNDILFVPSHKMYYPMPLYALDGATGDILWENSDSFGGYWDSSPTMIDGVIYINGVDGSCRAINATDGVTIWEAPLTAGGVYDHLTATPVFHQDRLFFGDQTESFYCLNADDGTIVWEVPGNQHGSPGYADGLLFYGEYNNPDNARVVALNALDGSEVWSYATNSTGIRSSPAITDGVVYIAGQDMNLYAFGSGLKYTYIDDFIAEAGSNALIVSSFFGGSAAGADTVHFTVTGTGMSPEPSGTLRLRASPNPFHSVSAISFELQGSGPVSLRVFDLSGRLVANLLEGNLPRGEHSLQWNGKSDEGTQVPPGLYLCRIVCGDSAETTGLCLLK